MLTYGFVAYNFLERTPKSLSAQDRDRHLNAQRSFILYTNIFTIYSNIKALKKPLIWELQTTTTPESLSAIPICPLKRVFTVFYFLRLYKYFFFNFTRSLNKHSTVKFPIYGIRAI